MQRLSPDLRDGRRLRVVAAVSHCRTKPAISNYPDFISGAAGLPPSNDGALQDRPVIRLWSILIEFPNSLHTQVEKPNFGES